LIQEQQFERVGGNETIKIDVRLIAATNKDLEEEVADGRFRNDLLYRLNSFTIRVPPLRARREDIALLVEHFLPQFSRALGREVRSVSPEAQIALRDHDWPGNVRQLLGVLKYAIIQAPGATLNLENLPENLRAATSPAAPHLPAPEASLAGLAEYTDSLLRGGETELYRRIAREVDRVVLPAVLRHVGGNQVKASQILGISRTTLRAKLQALDDENPTGASAGAPEA
jgi:two-component system nitrogen regulation response regulator GlnG